jgi:hypothetical protein
MINKHSRYRSRLRSEGRCTHCGKECAPYAECEERRAYRQAMRFMNRLERIGLAKKRDGRFLILVGDATVNCYWTKPNDSRLLPRIRGTRGRPNDAHAYEFPTQQALTLKERVNQLKFFFRTRLPVDGFSGLSSLALNCPAQLPTSVIDRDALLSEIHKAVQRVHEGIRDDVEQELVMGALVGEFSPNEITAAVGRYAKKIRGQQETLYLRSLDDDQ